MSSDLRESIFKTLAYADIFDYPLTLDEIWRFWIGEKTASKDWIKKEIESFSFICNSNKILFFLKGKEENVKIRQEREKEGRKKYKIVQKVAYLFSHIPSVYLIGISGGLAMNNVSKNDDIDLFIITKKNTLFTTRLFLILFLDLLGLRRKRGDNDVFDKICLNMIIDETAFILPPQKQNLYCAHEVVQMVPVFERDDTYKKFIRANMWIRRFLPNSLKRKTLQNFTKNYAEFSFISVVLRFILCFSAFEFLAKNLQLYFIKRHQTREIISDHILAFHPHDYQTKILSEYNKRLRLYEKI